MHRVDQVGRGDGRIGDVGLHLRLLGLQVEGLALGLPLLLLLLLVLVLGAAEEGARAGS